MHKFGGGNEASLHSDPKFVARGWNAIPRKFARLEDESFDDAAMDAVQELGDEAEVQAWFAECCAA